MAYQATTEWYKKPIYLIVFGLILNWIFLPLLNNFIRGDILFPLNLLGWGLIIYGIIKGIKSKNSSNVETGNNVKTYDNAVGNNYDLSGDVIISEEVKRRTYQLTKSGNKLEAMKYYKDMTGVGLKEAKDYVDSLSLTNSSHQRANDSIDEANLNF